MRFRAAAAIASLACVTAGVPASRAAGSVDPLRSQQWALDQVHADQAWGVSTGRGQVVAVLDDGVDLTHPDLRGQLVQGKSLSGPASLQDDCGHGTEVAGVLVAKRGNGVGLAGIAPDAKVMPLRVGSGCLYNQDAIAAAIRYAAHRGVRVVSISIGQQPVAGDVAFDALAAAAFQSAVDEAWSRGTLVVLAAGNDSLPYCTHPAEAPHALCVGAVGQDRTKAWYSNSEVTPGVDYLVAPGGGNFPGQQNVWTTTAGGIDPTTAASTGQPSASGYDQVSGTSFATPYVAGIAALLFARGLTAPQVRERLLSTATDLGVPGRDPIYGWGEVDAAAAVRG